MRNFRRRLYFGVKVGFLFWTLEDTDGQHAPLCVYLFALQTEGVASIFTLCGTPIPEYPVTQATAVFPLLIGTEVNRGDGQGLCIICVCPRQSQRACATWISIKLTPSSVHL